MSDRFAVSAALREIGELLAALGENRFRSRAYARAAEAVEGLEEDLEAVTREGRLTALPGVGAALARVIEELVGQGRSALLERLREQLPAGLLELASLRGLSLERARALHRELGITTVAELEEACRAGRVRAVHGFGPKTEQRLLAAIERHREGSDQQVAVALWPTAERLLAYLRAGGARVEPGGALGRREEVADRLVLVAASDDPAAVGARLAAYPAVARVEEREDERLRVRLGAGLPVELLAVPPGRFGAALVAATAAPSHWQALVERAAARGLELDRRGLRPARGGGERELPEEADLYRQLDLPPLPAELRGDADSVAAALAGDTFEDLVTGADLRGAVHCHTVWSDGSDTIEDMARAAAAAGLEYLTITDHSRSASYAGGLEPERLRAQWAEIARVQETAPVRLLRGSECDILPDGGLDYDDALLAGLEVVIASIHVRHGLDEEGMTRRVVRALEHPRFKIWGHPLGRLVLRRPPIPVRMDEVLAAAARSPAAVEINGDPYRLDLEARWLREARRRGLRFVISSDAHSARGLRAVRHGVALARRGWVRRGEVLNALPAAAFLAAVA